MKEQLNNFFALIEQKRSVDTKTYFLVQIYRVPVLTCKKVGVGSGTLKNVPV